MFMACVTMAFSFACDKAGLATRSIDTPASVRLSPQGEGFLIERIALTLNAVVPGIDEGQLQEIDPTALSRWESDGGAGLAIPEGSAFGNVTLDDPATAHTEAVQLRIRVIALENLVVASLAQAPVAQLALALAMAAYISPRPGYTPHPLTLRAADEMRSLVDRALRFRATPAA